MLVDFIFCQGVCGGVGLEIVLFFCLFQVWEVSERYFLLESITVSAEQLAETYLLLSCFFFSLVSQSICNDSFLLLCHLHLCICTFGICVLVSELMLSLLGYCSLEFSSCFATAPYSYIIYIFLSHI